MTLKDILRKRDKIKESQPPKSSPPRDDPPDVPEFTFLRTDTNTQEIIYPPSLDGDQAIPPPPFPVKESPHLQSRPSRFRSHSHVSASSAESSHGERRLSQRLHLRSRSRASSASSVNVPTGLPTIGDDRQGGEENEAQWEKRATILAKGNPNIRVAAHPDAPVTAATVVLDLEREEQSGEPSAKIGHVSDAQGDVRDHLV